MLRCTPPSSTPYYVAITEHVTPLDVFRPLRLAVGRLRSACRLDFAQLAPRPHSALPRHTSPCQICPKSLPARRSADCPASPEAAAAADTRKHGNQAEGPGHSTWHFHRLVSPNIISSLSCNTPATPFSHSPVTALLIDRRAKGVTRSDHWRVKAKTTIRAHQASPPDSQVLELNVSQDPSPGPEQGTPDARRRHLRDGVNQIMTASVHATIASHPQFRPSCRWKISEGCLSKTRLGNVHHTGTSMEIAITTPRGDAKSTKGRSIRIGDRLANNPTP